MVKFKNTILVAEELKMLKYFCIPAIRHLMVKSTNVFLVFLKYYNAAVRHLMVKFEDDRIFFWHPKPRVSDFQRGPEPKYGIWEI